MDPLGANVRHFRAVYDWFAVLTVGLLASVHGILLSFNLGYDVSVLQLPAPGVAVVCPEYGAALLAGPAVAATL